MAGTTGAAGMTGMAGTNGSGGANAFNGALKIQYEVRQNGLSTPQAEFSIKVVNTGTTPIALNSVSVRYWYTMDGTGAQAGTCANPLHPCTIAFQTPATTKPTADQYAVISFAAGTIAPGADTGEVQITMHGSGNYDQSNDYSFTDTGANFIDQPNITGYVAGKLVWGAPPGDAAVDGCNRANWTFTAQIICVDPPNASCAALNPTLRAPQYAIDGDQATRYTDGQTQVGGEYVTLSFGATIELAGITLMALPATDSAKAYKVEYSTDATNFVPFNPAVQGVGGVSPLTITFPSATLLQALKITQTGMAIAPDVSWWSISEITLTGCKPH
jgi:hypothetical protein